LHICLTEFTIYSLTFSAPDAYKILFREPLITADNHPPISDIEFNDWVVGKTFDNYWIAIGNVSSGKNNLYKKEPLPEVRESQLERTTLEFLDELGNILKKFYPEEYIWEIYPTREGVLKRIFSSTRLIIPSDFDGLEQRFMLSELPDLPSGQLCQSLQENLINITEYNLFDYYTYFIGQTHWGDWARVWTQEPWH
jgi:hypothetical protein